MAGSIVMGKDTIKIGACGANGVMGATLAAIGLTVPDSVVFTMGETVINEIFCEESSAAIVAFADDKRDIKLEWETMDFEPATLLRLFGGTVATTKWTPPVTPASIEQSVELVTKSVDGSARKFAAPRAALFASIIGNIKKNEAAKIKITAKILSPIDATGTVLPPFSIDKV